MEHQENKSGFLRHKWTVSLRAVISAQFEGWFTIGSNLVKEESYSEKGESRLAIFPLSSLINLFERKLMSFRHSNKADVRKRYLCPHGLHLQSPKRGKTKINEFTAS